MLQTISLSSGQTFFPLLPQTVVSIVPFLMMSSSTAAHKCGQSSLTAVISSLRRLEQFLVLFILSFDENFQFHSESF